MAVNELIKKGMSATARDLIIRMYDLLLEAVEGVEFLQKGLIYGRLNLVESVRGAVEKVRGAEKNLTEGLLTESKSDPAVSRYIPLPAHLERIANYLESLTLSLEAKIKEDVLLSDKAQNELNYLFESTHDLLSNAADIVLARNRIVAGYIKEAESAIAKAANDFSTKHEERLIEGICLPKASSLYLNMLDAFKGIAWHGREIADKLI